MKFILIICFKFEALDESFHMPSNSHLCSDCGKTFKSKSGILKHIRTKHKQPRLKYQCTTCQKSFTEKHQIQAHRVQHGGRGISCDLCNKDFTTVFVMRRHRAGVHENAKHTCATCNAVFGDRDVLKEHVKGVHQLVRSSKAAALIFNNLSLYNSTT